MALSVGMGADSKEPMRLDPCSRRIVDANLDLVDYLITSLEVEQFLESLAPLPPGNF